MTDAQEIILDYLMGAEKIGPYWSTGPLGLAVRALQEKRLSSRRDASQALGYPGVLCHAVQGASSVLKGADERRKLAISVFAAVPTRPTIPRLTRQRSVEVATWAALRVHPLAHSDPCPYATLLTRRRQQYLDNGSWLEGRFPVDHEALVVKCPARHPSAGWTREWENSAAGRGYHSLWYATNVVYAAAGTGREMGHYLKLVGRDAGACTAVALGVEAAVEFCVALAAELKMDEG